MEKFKLVSEYSPMGDQPTAIKQLVEGIRAGQKEQVLLGGTGTGKTLLFLMLLPKSINQHWF